MKTLKSLKGKEVKNQTAVIGGKASKEEANQLKSALEAVGATVDLK